MQRFIAALFVLVAATAASFANEIEGFRLGMSLSQAKELALEKGYAFSNPLKTAGNQRWVSYVLMKDGPSLSFCDTTLSSVSTQHASNFHEIASAMRDWQSKLGEPELLSNPTYVQGVQYSSLDFRWVGNDNVRRSLTVSQYGQNQINIGFGYSFVQHPCR